MWVSVQNFHILTFLLMVTSLHVVSKLTILYLPTIFCVCLPRLPSQSAYVHVPAHTRSSWQLLTQMMVCVHGVVVLARTRRRTDRLIMGYSYSYPLEANVHFLRNLNPTPSSNPFELNSNEFEFKFFQQEQTLCTWIKHI